MANRFPDKIGPFDHYTRIHSRNLKTGILVQFSEFLCASIDKLRTEYSQYQKTEPWSVFELDFCLNVEWSGFGMALNRFVYMNIYIYIQNGPKPFKTGLFVRFSNGFNKMAAKAI
jgi:hypothetical protein